MKLQNAAFLCAALFLVGCGSPDSGSASVEKESIDTEPTSTSAGVTPSDAAELTARAVERACELHCGEFAIYVRDEILTATTLSGAEEAMPQLVKAAVAEHVDRAEFITADEEAALIVGGQLTDPRVAIVNVGPVADLGNNVVGVDIGVVTARDGFRYETHQFLWTGDEWKLTSGEETGVTVTTSVS